MIWEPIETAPRDESALLLWFPDAELKVRAAFWSPDGDWFEYEWSGHPITDLCGQPTHWMPIPKPPTTNKE